MFLLPLVPYSRFLFIHYQLFCCNDSVLTPHGRVIEALCQQFMMLLMSKLQLCFVPLSLVSHMVPPALPLFSPLQRSLLIQASLCYTPPPVLLFIPKFIPQIISYVVITFPLLTVPLPLATLCVFVCGLCVWWLMAGH